jgi:hypothetical protein
VSIPPGIAGELFNTIENPLAAERLMLQPESK